MYFELIGELSAIEVIVEGSKIRQLALLEELYGRGRWRKLKGIGSVRLEDGRIVRAEIHWYEAHGVGRKRLKVKKFFG
ncbi:MAG TPA: hypothetical protein VN783_13955 [Thermoanaerobaculia bacterium]|nr:hypothetical protein [Thermoanaerobaculia bacterium]